MYLFARSMPATNAAFHHPHRHQHKQPLMSGVEPAGLEIVLPNSAPKSAFLVNAAVRRMHIIQYPTAHHAVERQQNT